MSPHCSTRPGRQAPQGRHDHASSEPGRDAPKRPGRGAADRHERRRPPRRSTHAHERRLRVHVFHARCDATVLPVFDPREVLDAIEQLKVTVIRSCRRCSTGWWTSRSHPMDASSLRAVIYGGSPIAPDRLARAIKAFGEVFIQLYGLSEAVMPLSALSQRDHRFSEGGSAPSRLASAGRASPRSGSCGSSTTMATNSPSETRAGSLFVETT